MNEFFKTELINEHQNESITNILITVFTVFSGFMMAMMTRRSENFEWYVLGWIILMIVNARRINKNNKRVRELKKERLVFTDDGIECYEVEQSFRFNKENLPIGIKVSKVKIEILTNEYKVLLLLLEEYSQSDWVHLKIRKQFRAFMGVHSITDFNLDKNLPE